MIPRLIENEASSFINGSRFEILSRNTIENQSKRSGFHADIFPVNALAITVSGLARYSFPGPERP